jgi:hypothetical protein
VKFSLFDFDKWGLPVFWSFLYCLLIASSGGRFSENDFWTLGLVGVLMALNIWTIWNGSTWHESLRAEE